MGLRKAKIKDIKDLAKIEMSSGYHKNKFDFEPYLRELFDKNSQIFCFEKEGNLVGYITLSEKGEIDFLAVSKKYQREGIANFLLKKIVSFGIKSKLKKIFLDVRSDNFSAISFYVKNNFKKVRSFKKEIGGKEIVKLRFERKI